MSTSPQPSHLSDAIGRYRYAYLMTTNAKGAPHATVVHPVLQGDELVVDGVGRRSCENAAARPAIGLVWPPEDPAGYSLIVDGHASLDGDRMRIAPTRAVLHRSLPSPNPRPGGCTSDCIELAFGAAVPA